MKLTHIDEEGKARMVDVGNKPPQVRKAMAEGFIRLQAETVHLIKENQIKKGDVLTIAEIAGIQAAKKPVNSSLFAIRLPSQKWPLKLLCRMRGCM